jgi:hypothetical protein
MLKKLQLLSIAVSLLFFPMLGFCEEPLSENPGTGLMEFYSADTKGMRMVNPYIANITAIREISGQRRIAEVRDYILWYLNHLNYPDKDGLTGTIYDYEISAIGEEKSTGHYDSVDGYAGTFLYLLNLYHGQTGDDVLIEDNWDKIKDIVYLIPYLQCEDGLTRPTLKAKGNVKYLMDNCESFAGIKSFNELSERTGHGRDAFYVETESDIKKAVNLILYSAEKKIFYWAIDDDVKFLSDWKTLYPDSIAQIFPICFSILDEDEGIRKALWKEFNKNHGEKISGLPIEQLTIYELTRKMMQDQK